MDYQTALSVAAKAVAYLQADEGNMSDAEMHIHLSALQLANRVICKRITGRETIL